MTVEIRVCSYMEGLVGRKSQLYGSRLWMLVALDERSDACLASSNIERFSSTSVS